MWIGSEASALLNNSRFSGNRAAEGGAAYVSTAFSDATTFSHSRFEWNNSTASGGTIVVAPAAYATLRACEVHRSYSTVGGALFLSGAETSIE